MTDVITVGDVAFEPGCYACCHRGYLGVSEVAADYAEHFGWEPSPDERADLERLREGDGSSDRIADSLPDTIDRALDHLNEVTKGGLWEWWDGNLMLWSWCGGDGCGNEECACQVAAW